VKVKLDENLGKSHAELGRAAGHVAARVTEQGLSGAKDPAMWQHVCDTERFFITLDLDFSDVRRFVPGTHPGILLIRSRGKGRGAVGVCSSAFWQSTGWSPWLAVWRWQTRAERVFAASRDIILGDRKVFQNPCGL
jgi:predicted nuclease of predicted toxin-antitoxin system